MAASAILEREIEELIKTRLRKINSLEDLKEQKEHEEESIRHLLNYLTIQRLMMNKQVEQQFDHRKELENQLYKVLHQYSMNESPIKLNETIERMLKLQQKQEVSLENLLNQNFKEETTIENLRVQLQDRFETTKKHEQDILDYIKEIDTQLAQLF